jgi:hypothetical protein
MSTRTIVTSQPDLACSVCERRLLRGEQPEVFLAAGEPRLVCELCAPRATQEGWLRESEDPVRSAPPPRTRRTRGIFGRLLGAARSEAPADPAEGATSPTEPDSAPAAARDAPAGAPEAGAGQPTDAAGPLAGGAAPDPGGESGGESGELDRATERLERALAVFNGDTYRRRIASLARSLGAPAVSVREDDDLGIVVIVVAWELCWYRYDVDIDLPEPTVAIAAQGTELAELGREDVLANATADELGSLSLTGAHV